MQKFIFQGYHQLWYAAYVRYVDVLSDNEHSEYARKITIGPFCKSST